MSGVLWFSVCVSIQILTQPFSHLQMYWASKLLLFKICTDCAAPMMLIAVTLPITFSYRILDTYAEAMVSPSVSSLID